MTLGIHQSVFFFFSFAFEQDASLVAYRMRSDKYLSKRHLVRSLMMHVRDPYNPVITFPAPARNHRETTRMDLMIHSPSP